MKGPGDQPQIKQTQSLFSQNLTRSGLLTQLVNMSLSDSGIMCFKEKHADNSGLTWLMGRKSSLNGGY